MAQSNEYQEIMAQMALANLLVSQGLQLAAAVGEWIEAASGRMTEEEQAAIRNAYNEQNAAHDERVAAARKRLGLDTSPGGDGGT